MLVREITIKQVANGWLNTTTGYVHKTAVLARAAVDRDQAKIVNGGGVHKISGVLINWEPANEAGLMVVKAITAKEE